MFEEYEPNQSYLRVASACPEVAVGNIEVNVERTQDLYENAALNDVSLVVFPELNITGYTIGDLVNQNVLLEQAKNGLVELTGTTHQYDTAMVVGLPLQVDNRLYNCAALLADGEIKGIVPKKNLPTYGEFYEDRWYQAWDEPNITIEIGGEEIPFGNDLLFDVGDTKIGLEVCEDLWVSNPPSVELAHKGALVIANPSASPEQVGKEEYRRGLVAGQSARLLAGYIYAGCDSSESTMDIVMGGHQLIAANGQVQAERPAFGGGNLLISDIDLEHLRHDRRRLGFAQELGGLVVNTQISRHQTDLANQIEPHPYLPAENARERNSRLNKILQIQAHGLANRMNNTSVNKLVLGLSGGLDSTLALFVATEAAKIIGVKPKDMIRTITMPGPASTENTQNNAQKLAIALGVPNETIGIEELVKTELEAIGHNGEMQDITYENVQARARTSILFNYGNKEGAMVLGTGDLSEIALGWCTYNADHMSHYNVNATVPKTLVRHLVDFAAKKYPKTREIVKNIIDTPISPELTKQDNHLTQETEDIIGPYELHDFFLSYHTRWGDEPAKIAYLANQAFADKYQPEEIDKWLEIYFERFARNQFKRSVMPDGPKIGSVALSPRGDWRMPSDMPNNQLWRT